MKIDKAAIETLRQDGVEFVLNVPAVDGVKMIGCSNADLQDLLYDPVSVYARAHGRYCRAVSRLA